MSTGPASAHSLLLVSLGLSAYSACSSSEAAPPRDADASVVQDLDASALGDATATETAPLPAGDPVDMPIDGVTPEQLAIFSEGDALFGLPLRDPDGLGPLYTRPSCSACHAGGLRGPGLVQKMSIVLADGLTPSPDQSKLVFGHTIHPLLAAGGTKPIVAPENDPSVKVSVRVGPPVLGRGYIEAILDSEIQRVAAEQAVRTDGIHGRINMVVYASEANSDTTFHTHRKGDSTIGRFGVKARIATVDDFVADALQGDMGITSPLRPTEFANPEGLADDLKSGVDLGLASINLRANYIRLIAIPKRGSLSVEGRAGFEAARCDGCHVPSMRTRPDYPIVQLANVDALVFSDLLLHDMGTALSDGLPEGVDGTATAREWRTAPLIGLRFLTTFMHDSRAHGIEEAILAHDGPGSEAHDSVERFKALTADDRAQLLDFVNAL